MRVDEPENLRAAKRERPMAATGNPEAEDVQRKKPLLPVAWVPELLRNKRKAEDEAEDEREDQGPAQEFAQDDIPMVVRTASWWWSLFVFVRWRRSELDVGRRCAPTFSGV